MIRPLILTALALVAATPSLATNARDTSRVQPNGQICYQVHITGDVWYSGSPIRTVCRTIGSAPGQPAIATPASVARLPRR
jgi:hypothetical protein